MGWGGTIQPCEILAQARHHYDGIIARHVSPGFENETVDNVKMIVLKFGRCQLWIEVEALLTDGFATRRAEV